MVFVKEVIIYVLWNGTNEHTQSYRDKSNATASLQKRRSAGTFGAYDWHMAEVRARPGWEREGC